MKKTSRLVAFVLAAVLAFAPAVSASSVQAAEYFTFFGKAVKRGWVISGGKKYYFNKNGQKVTGVHKISGKIYAFDRTTGALIRNKILYKSGSNYFRIDKAGVATRIGGTAAKAAKLIYAQMMQGNAFNMLKLSFLWVADFTFNSNMPEPGAGMIKSTYYGQWGLSKKSGDCTAQAYTFYWMAKALGYQVRVINGYYALGTDFKEHSWCEINHNGTIFVYDPNFNMEFRNKYSRDAYGFNSLGFKVRYGAKNTLPYCRPNKTRIETGGKA